MSAKNLRAKSLSAKAVSAGSSLADMAAPCSSTREVATAKGAHAKRSSGETSNGKRSEASPALAKTPRRAARVPVCAPATISEGDGVRYLHLDSPWVQGAMRLRKPLALELEYVQRMMAGLLLLPVPSGPDTSPGWQELAALQLGLGAASLTRFCHGVLGLRTTAVEINPSVIDACRIWFRLPADDARLQVVQADAAAYVQQADAAGTFSLIQVDLYDHEAAGPVLDSLAFYAACRALLTPDGVMTVNLFGRDASFERSAAHIAQAFAGGQVFGLRPTREGNTVVVASAAPELPSREEMSQRARYIEDHWKLPAGKWLRMIRALPPLAADPAS
jgi:spermidine synthase